MTDMIDSEHNVALSLADTIEMLIGETIGEGDDPWITGRDVSDFHEKLRETFRDAKRQHPDLPHAATAYALGIAIGRHQGRVRDGNYWAGFLCGLADGGLDDVQGH